MAPHRLVAALLLRAARPLVAPARTFSRGSAGVRAADAPDPAEVAAGALERRARLDAALAEIGFDASTLETEALRGSSALATYRSFVVPKTAKGLADSLAPARAASIAVDVSGLARKHVADRADWLRNRDREVAAAEPAHGDLRIILDGLRSGENVGSVLRTAETAGVGAVYCCGTTPTPPNPAVLRAAMGAADFVNVAREPSTLDAVLALQGDGVTVWACETTARSEDLLAAAEPPPKPLALVFGHEEFGVHVDVLAAADAIVAIPTFGKKNSLNVANACAIAVFDVVRRWRA